MRFVCDSEVASQLPIALTVIKSLCKNEAALFLLTRFSVSAASAATVESAIAVALPSPPVVDGPSPPPLPIIGLLLLS